MAYGSLMHDKFL